MLSKFTAKAKNIFSNITEEEMKTIHNLRKDDSCMVLTIDKGVALVIIHKDMFIEKCIALLNDEEVYCKCKDQTKFIHCKVLKQLLDLEKTSLDQNSRTNKSNSTLQVTIALLSDSRFYLKFIKPTLPSNLCFSMWYKVIHLNLAKFLTEFFNCTVVIVSYLARRAKDEPNLHRNKRLLQMTLVLLDISALSTSILVTIALKVINRKFTEHITHTGVENFVKHPSFIPRDKVISLWELVLNNCVFSFQVKF